MRNVKCENVSEIRKRPSTWNLNEYTIMIKSTNQGNESLKIKFSYPKKVHWHIYHQLRVHNHSATRDEHANPVDTSTERRAIARLRESLRQRRSTMESISATRRVERKHVEKKWWDVRAQVWRNTSTRPPYDDIEYVRTNTSRRQHSTRVINFCSAMPVMDDNNGVTSPYLRVNTSLELHHGQREWVEPQ